ncbi:cell division protein FtsX [Melioribacteraceae bacterium 4301-Me]|uniref:cell division protein FtsX n=1 Tax=Pyranulibacter aquaticus TaxID=3163344 RepID=UPI0035949E96
MMLFYLSEAVKLFKRSPLGSFITIITTAIAVGITTFAFLLIFLSNNISEKLKSNVEINVFLKENYSSDDKINFENFLRGNNIIKKFNFISKEEAEKKFIYETGESFKDILDVNPLPASYKLYLKPKFVDENKIEELKKQIIQNPIVDDVVFDYSTLLRILNIINKLSTFVYLIAILLFVLSVYLVFSNSKLVIKSREKTYNTMKLIGTKLFSIRFPILLNGIIIGLISSLMVIIVVFFAFYLLQKLYPFINIGVSLYFIYSLILLLGLILGLSGSYIAARSITLQFN